MIFKVAIYLGGERFEEAEHVMPIFTGTMQERNEARAELIAKKATALKTQFLNKIIKVAFDYYIVAEIPSRPPQDVII